MCFPAASDFLASKECAQSVPSKLGLAWTSLQTTKNTKGRGRKEALPVKWFQRPWTQTVDRTEGDDSRKHPRKKVASWSSCPSRREIRARSGSTGQEWSS